MYQQEKGWDRYQRLKALKRDKKAKRDQIRQAKADQELRRHETRHQQTKLEAGPTGPEGTHPPPRMRAESKEDETEDDPRRRPGCNCDFIALHLEVNHINGYLAIPERLISCPYHSREHQAYYLERFTAEIALNGSNRQVGALILRGPLWWRKEVSDLGQQFDRLFKAWRRFKDSSRNSLTHPWQEVRCHLPIPFMAPAVAKGLEGYCSHLRHVTDIKDGIASLVVFYVVPRGHTLDYAEIQKRFENQRSGEMGGCDLTALYGPTRFNPDDDHLLEIFGRTTWFPWGLDYNQIPSKSWIDNDGNAIDWVEYAKGKRYYLWRGDWDDPRNLADFTAPNGDAMERVVVRLEQRLVEQETGDPVSVHCVAKEDGDYYNCTVTGDRLDPLPISIGDPVIQLQYRYVLYIDHIPLILDPADIAAESDWRTVYEQNRHRLPPASTPAHIVIEKIEALIARNAAESARNKAYRRRTRHPGFITVSA